MGRIVKDNTDYSHIQMDEDTFRAYLNKLTAESITAFYDQFTEEVNIYDSSIKGDKENVKSNLE
jgi:hypothetical protein